MRSEESCVVRLNVGGVEFSTYQSTLMKSPLLEMLFRHERGTDEVVFVDRDPELFKYVLRWLRSSHVIPKSESHAFELMIEAEYYGITEMVTYLQGNMDCIRRRDLSYQLYLLSSKHTG